MGLTLVLDFGPPTFGLDVSAMFLQQQGAKVDNGETSSVHAEIFPGEMKHYGISATISDSTEGFR